MTKYLTSYSTVCKSVAWLHQKSDLHKLKVVFLPGIPSLEKREDV